MHIASPLWFWLDAILSYTCFNFLHKAAPVCWHEAPILQLKARDILYQPLNRWYRIWMAVYVLLFSKIDFLMHYHQTEIDEASREIATFVTDKGLFRFERFWRQMCNISFRISKLHYMAHEKELGVDNCKLRATVISIYVRRWAGTWDDWLQ